MIRKKWEEEEIRSVINIVINKGWNEKYRGISKDIEESYTYFIYKNNHSFSSYKTLIYNIIFVFSNGDYGLSSVSKKVKEMINNEFNHI
ncbi:MAG: hypothetical protein ACRCRP_02455 [Metamycoplasmataceae bacterium]